MAEQVLSRQEMEFFGDFDTLIDVVSPTVRYIGEAEIGTPTSAAKWKIIKSDTTQGIANAQEGRGEFNLVWDDRATYTYAF